MKMKNLVLAFTVALAAFGVQAEKKPNYGEARKVYDEINQSLHATGLWYKKSLTERIRGRQAAGKLVERTERLLGSSSRCREAAILMDDYIGNLNSFALILEGKRQITAPNELFGAMFNAVTFGEKRAACYDEVEALDVQAQPRK